MLHQWKPVSIPNVKEDNIYDVGLYTKHNSIEESVEYNAKHNGIKESVAYNTHNRVKESVEYNTQQKRSKESVNTRYIGGGGMKTILWYDTYGQTMVRHSYKINLSDCKFNKCKFKYVLTDNDLKPKKPFDADAVLIQGEAILTLSPPPRRDKDQIFVLAMRDSTGGIRRARNEPGKLWAHAFNWTMTFRRDSDIVYKYSNIIQKQENINSTDEHYADIFNKKEKNVAWLVSHCITSSHREDYVNELNKVIDVDKYGNCGQKICLHRNRSCLSDMEKKYKFYLAFENAFYTDYVTEKLFDWYNRDIIVVVRGGANYSIIVPPRTVIDASDFNSPTELGMFLKKVAADKDMYSSYLRRKDNYYSTSRLDEAQQANCKLCEYLHTLDYHRKTYTDIRRWWLGHWVDYKKPVRHRRRQIDA